MGVLSALMRSLQTLLTILGGEKLAAGYLTPAGTGTAHETVRALIQATDPIVVLGTPIIPPGLLNTPAWVSSLRGRDAIYLNTFDGNLDLSKAGPAYLFGGV
jgi:hypothetical protein